MPPIKLEKVVSVSSEDAVHSASNLLKGDFNNKKWKSQNPGEKQISAVFQLEKPSKITSVDVGNENSAFVEILVAKSSVGDSVFEVLLAASSLMSLAEAKNSTNTNGVKFYKTDDLCKETLNSKWDRIKIVCTQPYNNIVQFGLSFVVFHTDEVVKHDVPDLGSFHLKANDSGPSSAQVSAWSLKAKKANTPELKGAAAVRAGDVKLPSAKNVAAKVTSFDPLDVDTDSDNYSPSDEPDSEDFNESDDSTKNRKKPPMKKKKKENQPKTPKTPKRKLDQGPKKPLAAKPKVAVVSHFASHPTKPFNRLLEGVAFVISGFQNPLRSDIRNSALAMGARYKADWDNSCTHLVCAFRNTPKFNQVQGRGKIVKKDWIEKCHQMRRRLPWRRFALDPQDANQDESEEEIFEEVARAPAPIDNRRRLNSSSEDDDVEKAVKRIKKQQENKLTKTPPKNSPVKANKNADNAASRPSGSKQTCEVSDDDNVTTNATNGSVYDAETDEDSEAEKNAQVLYGLPALPAFFDSWNFILLDDLSADERAKLTRYILARSGNIVSNMSELSPSSVVYCITQEQSRVNEVIEALPQVQVVLPDWIWLCHDENQLQDAKPYRL